MGDFGNGSTGAGGPHFYSFDYTNYNPNNDGRAPPYPAGGETHFFPSMTFSSGEGTFQTIHGSFNSRLRRISDFEPVKHKRSRNGCYTCRSRRVKCDEERPKCGRCSKSKRECVFPELPKNASSKEGPAKSSDDENASPEKSESAASKQNDKSESVEGSSTYEDSQLDLNQHTSPLSENESHADLANVPQDVLEYMEYFEQHVSHHHYGFIDPDEGNALRTLLSQFVHYDEALIYAVVAFCAFLKTVASGRNSLEDFLGYYNTSMALLRQSLITRGGVSVTTLMTVLQLALLEEYLGDWVNLQSHQRAALKIITEMFTPQTVVQDPSSRILLHWYIRFDQFTAFISQNTTLLELEWWEADSNLTDHDLAIQDEDRLVRLRCDKDLRSLSKDISILFTQSGQAPASGGADMATLQNLATQLQTWRNEFEAPLLQQAHMPISPDSPMPSSPPSGEDHDAKRMWAAKHLLVHFWNLQLIFQYLLAMAQQQQPSVDFFVLAKRISDLMEDIIENDPHPDAIIGIRGPLAISSIALSHDPERVSWCQNQLSNIESRGYLYPSTFRKHVPDMTGNVMEVESETGGTEVKPMIQVVREWIEERTNDAHDLQSENIRQMAGIFRPHEEY